VYAQKGRPFCVSAEIAGTDLINQLHPSQTQVSKNTGGETTYKVMVQIHGNIVQRSHKTPMRVVKIG
jgi:hypothetical protein